MIARFLALPIVVNLLASLGGSVRFYRTVFVEEIHRDYVRTARAKGAGTRASWAGTCSETP